MGHPNLPSISSTPRQPPSPSFPTQHQIELIDFRTISSLVIEPVVKSMGRTKRLVIVYQAGLMGEYFFVLFLPSFRSLPFSLV
ncbi:uncharacterized protein BJ212DRAFT_1313264 [Suillus subaureus]|uniref:Uncharacterized protein n=1 Tax=Suillus subaureus TaxID=48587 RepID=A0A9P7JK98_9AGAM|nr:uncharacterized protein BJ212DRAFT_1313264 [Suillus subaureus]KAG1827589.1 hypothetical protein BJ212DRAFT_1313264 [Suillus subaureus]